MSDWLEGFLELTEGLPTPPLFRLWAGISSLSSVLERKVWLPTARQVLFPNLFILLVGPPGSGKTQSIRPAKVLLQAAKSVRLSPSDMTKAAMIDVFAGSEKKILFDGVTTTYHPLCVVLSEFGTLVSAYDLEFMSTINTAFDNEDITSQRRGHNDGKMISIRNASLNILAGTQPGYLAELLPETAWSMGFASRLMMIYSAVAPSIDMFDEGREQEELFADLAKGLVERGKLLGPSSDRRGREDDATCVECERNGTSSRALEAGPLPLPPRAVRIEALHDRLDRARHLDDDKPERCGKGEIVAPERGTSDARYLPRHGGEERCHGDE